MRKLLLVLLTIAVLRAETVISPNMNLPVPVVGQTPGPTWANNINACMSSIDSHDHTAGKGVPISSDAINLTSDLSLNGNSLTNVEATIYSSQASFATNQSLYVINPDLYYNDGNGNVIRITQSGSVAGASGTITGLPSGTASASYQSVGGTFQFQSATSTPANITGASITVAPQTASPNGITIKSPSPLSASYNLTLPTSVPSYTSLLTMSTSGVLATVPYKLPTIQKFTSGSGTYTLPTSPSPIYIQVEAIGGGGAGYSGNTPTTAGSNGGDTTFGTALISAGGGVACVAQSDKGAAGGTSSLGAAVGLAISGGMGGPSGRASASLEGATGGSGGNGAFGGGGSGGSGNQAGSAGATNTGGGGGGGGGSGNNETGCGGGSGGYVKAIITSPSSTYSYAVGSGGSAGTGGNVGGAGGSGVIVVTEYYQ